MIAGGRQSGWTLESWPQAQIIVTAMKPQLLRAPSRLRKGSQQQVQWDKQQHGAQATIRPAISCSELEEKARAQGAGLMVLCGGLLSSPFLRFPFWDEIKTQCANYSHQRYKFKCGCLGFFGVLFFSFFNLNAHLHNHRVYLSSCLLGVLLPTFSPWRQISLVFSAFKGQVLCSPSTWLQLGLAVWINSHPWKADSPLDTDLHQSLLIQRPWYQSFP